MTTEANALPQRSEIPLEYTWDLSTLFADEAGWQQMIADVEADLPKLTALQGQLASDPEALLDALEQRDSLGKRLQAIYVYANLRRDSDSNDPSGQALSERAGAFYARVAASVAFVDPEILGIPEETLSEWIAKLPDLAVYTRSLDLLNRQRAHIRSAEVEQVMAEYSDVMQASYKTFSTLTDSDLVFPTIEDDEGRTITLSHARFGRLMEHPDRRVRHDAFKGYYSAFRPFRNTLATTLGATVRANVVSARLRGYGSALEAALSPNEIPTAVYHNLISTVEANLPRLHRYYDLRKKVMGLDDLRIYDLYVQPVPDVELAVPYHEAIDLMRNAFAPLGPDYAEALDRTFTSRWIDVYENRGKRSGAYSWGCYTSPPFILLNYQDNLNDAFTLAHELGHSMHSFFTRKTQPFAYSGYTTFVAEVASTLNEALLTSHLLNTRDDVALRRRLIVQQLDDLRSTLFRQTMFATFELEMHRMAEAGEALTNEALSERYYQLVRTYHGPAVTLDDEIAFEWARIPHFYYGFYVYQYATGISAALALHRGLEREGAAAIERYLTFLSGGSAQSPIDLLRGAGVDMAGPDAIQAAMDEVAHLIDQLEALI